MLWGMADVTGILSQIESGDPSAAEQVFGIEFRSLEAGLREYLP